MSALTLYGDGIHDDTPAIQAMLDSKICEVSLPAPKEHYCISKTLRIYSNQTLRLPETARVRLLPMSDCYMLTNAERDAHDIVICGGIWDMDNLSQSPNPLIAQAERMQEITHLSGRRDLTVTHESLGYFGCVFSFSHITRLSIHDLTIKDPITFCIRIGYVSYFTVENIRFDMNLGNPLAMNMDGIHVDGGCHFGCIRNVQGTCYDDVVAINADDNYDGPISDISVDGVFGANSLRGVRLLSIKSPVERISISNIYGTFYQNAVSLTYYFPRNGIRGKMSHITVNNVFASNAHRIPEYGKGDDSVFGFSHLWIDGTLDIDYLGVSNFFRRESIGRVETIHICPDANIGTLSLCNILQQNETGEPMTLLLNEGNIKKLCMSNVDSGNDRLLDNRGNIEKIIDNAI